MLSCMSRPEEIRPQRDKKGVEEAIYNRTMAYLGYNRLTVWDELGESRVPKYAKDREDAAAEPRLAQTHLATLG